jgi:hypothetical protein
LNYFIVAVIEKKIFKNKPIRNKNYLWWPCLLTDQDEMSNEDLLIFFKSSLKQLYQMNRNLIGSILGRSSIKMAHLVSIRLQTWLPQAILVSDWPLFRGSLPRKSLISRMDWVSCAGDINLPHDIPPTKKSRTMKSWPKNIRTRWWYLKNIENRLMISEKTYRTRWWYLKKHTEHTGDIWKTYRTHWWYLKNIQNTLVTSEKRYNFVRLKAMHKISPLEELVGGRSPPSTPP